MRFRFARFIRFGIVGASGVLVNVCVLYICRNFVFQSVDASWHDIDVGLNLSLCTAIFLSMLNNFYINKNWTWADKRTSDRLSLGTNFKLFLKYSTASSLSIGIQIFLTNLFVLLSIQYLLANLMAIGGAAVASFMLNHYFTFKGQPT